LVLRVVSSRAVALGRIGSRSFGSLHGRARGLRVRNLSSKPFFFLAGGQQPALHWALDPRLEEPFTHVPHRGINWLSLSARCFNRSCRRRFADSLRLFRLGLRPFPVSPHHVFPFFDVASRAISCSVGNAPGESRLEPAPLTICSIATPPTNVLGAFGARGGQPDHRYSSPTPSQESSTGPSQRR